jgi:hypothetical protein
LLGSCKGDCEVGNVLKAAMGLLKDLKIESLKKDKTKSPEDNEIMVDISNESSIVRGAKRLPEQ